MLQKQKLKIPVTSGINDKVSEFVKGPQFLQELNNCDAKTSGQVTKRSGFETLYSQAGDIKKIHGKGNELLFVDGDELYKFKDVGGSYDTDVIGQIQGSYLPQEIIAISNSGTVEWLDYEISGDILFYSYIATAPLTNNKSVFYGLYDLSECIYITKDQVIFASSSEAAFSKSVLLGSNYWVVVVYDNAGTDAISLWRINAAGTVIAGHVIAEEPDGAEPKDIDFITDGSFAYLCFRQKSTTNGIFKKFDVSTISSISLGAMDWNHISLVAHGGFLYASYVRTAGSNKNIEQKKFLTSSFSLVNTVIVQSLIATDSPYSIDYTKNLTNVYVSSGGTDYIYIYMDRGDVITPLGLSGLEHETRGVVYWIVNIDTDSAVSATERVLAYSSYRIAGRPFVEASGNILFPLLIQDDQRVETGLVTVRQRPTESAPVNTDFNLVGRYYYQQTGEHVRSENYKIPFSSYGFLNLIRDRITGYVPVTGKPDRPDYHNYGLLVSFRPQPKPCMVNFDRYTFLSGNFLHSYDGNGLYESNFLHAPVVEADIVDSTGGFFSDGVIQVKGVFRFIDFTGKLVESSPTAAYTITLAKGTSTQKLTVSFGRYSVSLRDIDDVEVAVYRTELNGSIFYFEGIAAVDTIDTGNSQATIIIDGVNESGLIQNEVVYTDSGEDGNNGVSACEILAVFDGRLCVSGGERPYDILYSKPERPEFYQLNPVITVPRESNAVTAFQELDSKLVIFGREDKHYVSGTGADQNGAGNYPPVSKIPSEQGAINQDSIVLTSMGIFFKSTEGIYLLDRGLNSAYIGAPVENFNNLTVTSSVSVEKWNELRFTTGSETIVYNYALKIWSINTTPSGFVSATNFNGDYCVSEGVNLYREDEDGFQDYGNSYDLRLKSAWIQLGDITGYQRLWRGTLAGRYIGDHTLTVKIYYDFEATESETLTFNVTSGNYEYEFLPARQRCKSLQIELLFAGDNECVALNAVEFLVGIKGLKNRIAVNKRMT